MKKSTIQKSKIGIFLSKYRIEIGITQREMASNLKMMASNLSSIESGKIPIPNNFKNKLMEAYVLTQNQINEVESIINESNSCKAYHCKNNIYSWVKNTCGILDESQREKFFDAVKKVESEYNQ